MKKRIQWEADTEEYKLFDNLRKSLRIETWRDLIIECFNLFWWAIEEVSNGRRIVSLGDDQKEKEYISRAIMTAKNNLKKPHP